MLRYLGRYTHRVAISNHRLVSFADGQVTFRWRDSAHGNQQKLLTLDLDEFLRRFLLHLLPPRFIRIRYFGFLAHCKRTALLPLCRRLIVRVKPSRTIFLGDDEPARSGWDCPRCGGRMRVVERFSAVELRIRPPPHSPPPDATTFSIASHSAASARSALVYLHDLPQPVPLAAATLSAPKPLASPCDHRSPYGSPAPLSPSKGSRPRIRTLCPSDSKRIDSLLPQKASFKSSYRKCSLCVGGHPSRFTDSYPFSVIVELVKVQRLPSRNSSNRFSTARIGRRGFSLAWHSGLLGLLGKGILARLNQLALGPIVFCLGSRPDCFLIDRFPGRHATGQLFDLREPLLLQDAGRDRGPISSRAMYGERPIFG